MGFSWTSISTGQIISEAEFIEIRNNINTVLSSLNTSWTWTNTADGGFVIGAAFTNELRDAVDYADEMNYCRTENITENTTYQGTADNLEDSTNDSGYYGTENSLEYSGQEGSIYNDQNTGVYGGYCPGYDSSWDGTYYGSNMGNG